MPVVLRIRDDLSANDIVRLAQNHLVEATPHVGNWTPARLVLPTLGVSILCVDHTIGVKDRNAHPHLLIAGGKAYELCDKPDRLTTHTYVTRKANGGMYPVGTSLSEVHVGTIRHLYPCADIATHMEHLREHRDITLTVLEEVTNLSRSATWWRRVDVEGRVTCYRSKDLPRCWSDIERDIFPLTKEREGWLIHNRVAILMDIILQSRLGREREIYHLSGPDMVKYLGYEIETLSRMYDHVRRRLGLIQETVTFNLVPFASFRFATRVSQAAYCERICEHLDRGDTGSTTLRSLLDAAQDILAVSETRAHFTQHDCRSTGERIIASAIASEWSMAACAQHLSTLQALV